MRKAGKLWAALGLCVIGSCVAPAAYFIAGAAFAIGLELLDAFRVTADGPPVRQAAAVDLLYPSQPADRPAGATLTLNPRNVQAVPLGVPKVRPVQQGVAGQATVDLLVAPSTDTNPCEHGASAGQFRFLFDGTSVSIQTGSITLPPDPLEFVTTGKFTLCVGVSSDTDASITIDEIGVDFSHELSPCPAGANCEPQAMDCVSFACPFGLKCDDELHCTAPACTEGSCPPSLLCGDDGQCKPFDCTAGSTDVCTLIGLTCVEGQCVPYPCTDSECPFATRCNAFNQCVTIACTGTNSCGPYLECTPSGVCAEIECVGVACPDGTRCEQGLCIPFECESDSNCSRHQVCSAFGQCVPRQCIESDCPYGEECDRVSGCIPYTCEPGNMDSCPLWMDCDPFSRKCTYSSCDALDACPGTVLGCMGAECVPFECQRDADCPFGSECSHFGECLPRNCTNAQCPFGLECQADFNTCLPFSCMNMPCPSGLNCDISSKLCVASGCSADGDCPSTLRCDGGHCVPRTCQSTSNCLSGLTCNTFGQCVPITTCPHDGECPAPGECTQDSDCQTGETCTNGTCTSGGGGNCIPGVNCDTECDGDNDCPDGMYCNSAHFCYDPNNIQCTFDSDCPQGQTCDARFQCR